VSGQSIVVVDNSRLLILFHFLSTNPFPSFLILSSTIPWYIIFLILVWFFHFPLSHPFRQCFISHTINYHHYQLLIKFSVSCPDFFPKPHCRHTMQLSECVCDSQTNKQSFQCQDSQCHTLFLNGNIFLLLLRSSPPIISPSHRHSINSRRTDL